MRDEQQPQQPKPPLDADPCRLGIDASLAIRPETQAGRGVPGQVLARRRR